MQSKRLPLCSSSRAEHLESTSAVAINLFPYVTPMTCLLSVDGRFGLAIIAIVCVQAGFGWHHHRMYIRNKPKRRRWYTHVHLWLGRFVIVFGVVNCGLGLLIAQVPMRWAIVWWACCSGFIMLYSGAYIYQLRLSVDSTDDVREPQKC